MLERRAHIGMELDLMTCTHTHNRAGVNKGILSMARDVSLRWNVVKTCVQNVLDVGRFLQGGQASCVERKLVSAHVAPGLSSARGRCFNNRHLNVVSYRMGTAYRNGLLLRDVIGTRQALEVRNTRNRIKSVRLKSDRNINPDVTFYSI